MLALGTTGEGILLSRRGAQARDRALRRGARRSKVIVALRRADDRGHGRARRARRRGGRRRGRGDRAAVLPARRATRCSRTSPRPPRACAPLPFYVYEFARASGYAVPLEVARAAARARAEPRRAQGLGHAVGGVRAVPLEGLDVFVGPEALIAQGMRARRVGAVSALASAFPGASWRRWSATRRRRGAGIGELRDAVERFPLHAALKRIVARRGVPMREDVRAPLRGLTDDERTELDAMARDRRSRRRCDRSVRSRTTSRSRRARRRARRRAARSPPARRRRRWAACASSSRPRRRCGSRGERSASSRSSGRRSSTRSATCSSRRPRTGLAALEQRRELQNELGVPVERSTRRSCAACARDDVLGAVSAGGRRRRPGRGRARARAPRAERGRGRARANDARERRRATCS